MDYKDNILFGELFDIYSNLLTSKQKEVFIDYYFNNLSLSEIAENNNISRQAVDFTLKNVLKALSSYEDALKAQTEVALETYYGITNKEVIEGVLKRFGYIKMKQPRKANGKKFKVKEMDKLLSKQQMKDGVLVTIANHHTCIVDGVIQDIWDCGEKTVGNYYVKGE